MLSNGHATAPEIHAELNRIVVMFLDFAEDQARRRKQVFLRDWQTRLDDFLRFNDRAVLSDAGRVTRESADRKAAEQYALFDARRRAEREAAGEEDTVRQLEQIARALPAERKTKKGQGGAR